MTRKIIHRFICRNDNLAVLIHDPQTGQTLAVDAPDADVMAKELTKLGWNLSHILLTHHHEDHIAGVEALRAHFACKIIGHEADQHRLPKLDRLVQADEAFSLMDEMVHVIATPGHTLGHIAYHLPGLQALFAGDCLFSLGCGRVFEGTLAQMWASLDRLRQLDPETDLYCGHDYTQNNTRFALLVEPQNEVLQKRVAQVEALGLSGACTLPSKLRDEFAANPFLRPESAAIRAYFGLQDASNTDVFAALRKAKDQFA